MTLTAGQLSQACTDQTPQEEGEFLGGTESVGPSVSGVVPTPPLRTLLFMYPASYFGRAIFSAMPMKA